MRTKAASAVLLDTNFTFAANVTLPGGSNRVHVFAENRLHAINTYLTNMSELQRSEFTYDGFNRWVQIVEKTNGVIGSTKRFIWDGGQLCQERDGNNNVIESFFPEGEQISGTNYYFVRDRLGSVEFILDTNGDSLGNYIYDPYGNQTQWQPSVNPDFGFAGYYLHQPSGLYLTWHRAYDSTAGRWLNQDPIGEAGGINLYAYVDNDPVNDIDPYDLDNFYGGSVNGTYNNNVPNITLSASARGGPVNTQFNGGGLQDPVFLLGAMTGGAAWLVGGAGGAGGQVAAAGGRVAGAGGRVAYVCVKKYGPTAIISGLGGLAIYETLKRLILPPDEDKQNNPEEPEEPNEQPSPDTSKSVPLPGSIPYPAPGR